MQVSKREIFKSVKIGFVAVKDVEAEGHRQCSSHAAMAMAALLMRCAVVTALLLGCGCCTPHAWNGHVPLMQRWPRSSCAAMVALLSYISKWHPRHSPYGGGHAPLALQLPCSSCAKVGALLLRGMFL